MTSTEPVAVVVPKELFYHEVAYVRGLEAKVKELEKALKPWSDFADALNEKVPDDTAVGIFADGAMRFGPSGGANVGHLRASRAALSATKEPKP